MRRPMGRCGHFGNSIAVFKVKRFAVLVGARSTVAGGRQSLTDMGSTLGLSRAGEYGFVDILCADVRPFSQSILWAVRLDR
ncbi:protein of unknown function [Methylocaldum szegediense]|jgi:hypothetical protein|uniref:Uncharacterized protein n=1 Tax=Methylocaldum szegediense TaxID=73780 RepID=A0ABN8X7W0_9GAMM|nr:protein of unknown function [Methylocaldum szegediense]